MQRIREETGIVNVYEMDIDKVKESFRYFCFEHYDDDWLQSDVKRPFASGSAANGWCAVPLRSDPLWS